MFDQGNQSTTRTLSINTRRAGSLSLPGTTLECDNRSTRWRIGRVASAGGGVHELHGSGGELCRRDQIRNQRLIELGWDVMRFWVYQVRDDLDRCVGRVREWVEKGGDEVRSEQRPEADDARDTLSLVARTIPLLDISKQPDILTMSILKTRASGSSQGMCMTEKQNIEAWLPLNSIDFLVLAVLTDGERHGYGIVKEITGRTDGRVKLRPGNLYRVVDRLMERGVVEARGKKAPDSTGEPRQHYGITRLGRKVVAAHTELFVDVVAASTRLKYAANRLD